MAKDQPRSMDTTNPPSGSTTRRTVLRAGGAGLAAAFLAACSTDREKAGVSGSPAPSTSTPPTVPTTEPSEEALEADRTQIRTAQSIELLVADVYTRFGTKLEDPTMRDAASRFAADHTMAAAVFASAGEETEESAKPNEHLQKNVVAPAEESLIDDTSILDFLASLESSLVATYINATGILTEAEWRQRTMGFGAASARRVAVLGNGGEGLAPTEPLYPVDDLISGDAFLGPKGEEAEGS